MSGPYINTGNYRYGIAELTQPCPAKYNHMLHHNSAWRDPSTLTTASKIREDGYPYLSNSYYKESSCCIGCHKCSRNGGIDRTTWLSNVLNVETYTEKVVTITFFGTKAELDTTVRLNVGSKYCVSYVTESGLESVQGIVKGFSSNMPDDCTKWIGTYGTNITNAYMELDCSSEGQSDKRLIYIASLRHIEPIYDEPYQEWAGLSQIEKLELMCQKVTDSINDINKYLGTFEPPIDPEAVVEAQNAIGDLDFRIARLEQNTLEPVPEEDPVPPEEEEKPGCQCKPVTKDCSCNGGPYIFGPVPLTKPPMFTPPWFWHHYFGDSCGCGSTGSGSDTGDTGSGDGANTEETPNVSEMLQSILDQLNSLGEVFKAFALQYETDMNDSGCCCTPKTSTEAGPYCSGCSK